MTLKNSDFRAYVAATQAPGTSGSSRLIGVALVAMVGLVGAYAYKIGFFSRSRPVAVAAAPASAAVKPAEPANPPPAQAVAEPPPLRAASAVSGRVDPRDANDALERVLAVSLKNNMNMLRGMDYMTSLEGVLKGGAPGQSPPGRMQAPQRRIDPKDVVAGCAQDLEQRMVGQPATAQNKTNLLMFTMLSELALCTTRRAESMICDKKPREQVISQIRFYDSLRGDALKVAAGDPETNRLVTAAFSIGVHEEIRRSLRQIGMKGGLKGSDFSRFPSKFISDAFDSGTPVPSRCIKA